MRPPSDVADWHVHAYRDNQTTRCKSVRNSLGNDLVPDYVTSVEEDGFHGWPWFYMGGYQYPRLMVTHPEFKSKVITPDVLVQPHMASLGMTVYPTPKSVFPSHYASDGFASEQGS